MRNNGRGGMQTAGAQYSIACPICGKPAARMEYTATGKRYMHYTRKGAVWHESKCNIRDDATPKMATEGSNT